MRQSLFRVNALNLDTIVSFLLILHCEADGTVGLYELVYLPLQAFFHGLELDRPRYK